MHFEEKLPWFYEKKQRTFGYYTVKLVYYTIFKNAW